MTTLEIKTKVLEGCRLAVLRLIEKRKRENSYLVVSENGKVVKKMAKDIKI
jgi:hypothetical protein